MIAIKTLREAWVSSNWS